MGVLEDKAVVYIKEKFAEIDFLNLSREEIEKKFDSFLPIVENYVKDKEVAQRLLDDYKILGNVGYEDYCSRFFPKKENKNLQASIEVLQEIAKQNVSNATITDKKALALKCESIKVDNERYNLSLFSDAVKILKCNQLLRANTTSLKINFEDWFREESRYEIRDYEVLEYLIPLLVTYIRTSKNVTAYDFFDKMDEVVGYFTNTVLSHNPNANMEKNIFEFIESQDTFTIINPPTKEKVDVIAEKIFIDKGGVKKVILLDDNDTAIEYCIDLEELVIV